MGNDEQKTGKLWEMIRPIRFAMLTSDDGGMLRSRPMVASQSDFDGTLWFFTRASSHKVDEVRAHDRVAVSYADPARQTYVSLSGHARLVRDKALIRDHWGEAVRTWFPKGIEDPDIALLRVDVEAAEYWDAPSSAMVHAYGYVKAVTTGKAPNPGDNEKLRLG
jgi:general stress protein 26